ISYSGLLELAVIIDSRYIRDSSSQNFSPMVDPLELSMMKYATDIPLDARFFDPSGCISAVFSRPAYLFGRYSVSDSSHAGEQTAPYAALVKKPSPDQLYQGGYTHVFFDQTWYNKLSPEAAQVLRTDPLEVIGWAGDAKNFRVLARICAPNQGCAPQVPGVMEELVPAQINFANSLAVTGFVRSIKDEDRTVHVKFSVLALRIMTENFHYSLRLTRQTDGKIYAVDGIAGTLTTNMVMGTTYLANEVTFKDVPAGDYRLSIGWYDINTSDLRPLQIVDPVPPSSNQEAVLLSLLKVEYNNSGS
ncbi:MAG TPA: hypothetical protein VKQ72_19430, partial [Aggregatilineales bacterium]|nr:hypothetical protein [Aggregatilineales bacterium]